MGRPQSETTTLVFAVCVAVALGVACGAWINARLASAASATFHASAQLQPAALVGKAAPSVETETAPGESLERAAAEGDDDSQNDSDAPSEPPGEGFSAAEGVGSRVRPVPGVLAPFTRETSPSEKASGARGRAQRAEAEPRAARGRVGASPCALYASAGSLTLRGGGAAPLVLGGPGGAGRVTVSTPDWSDIAVFSEGRAGGNGWVRYSVRSVSRRAGVYRVHVKTPCGSQSIPVTVTRQ